MIYKRRWQQSFSLFTVVVTGQWCLTEHRMMLPDLRSDLSKWRRHLDRTLNGDKVGLVYESGGVMSLTAGFR